MAFSTKASEWKNSNVINEMKCAETKTPNESCVSEFDFHYVPLKRSFFVGVEYTA